VLRGHDGSVESVVFLPDGTSLVSVSADDTVRRWRLDGVSQAKAASIPLRPAEATTAIMGRDGRPATPVDGAAVPAAPLACPHHPLRRRR